MLTQELFQNLLDAFIGNDPVTMFWAAQIADLPIDNTPIGLDEALQKAVDNFTVEMAEFRPIGDHTSLLEFADPAIRIVLPPETHPTIPAICADNKMLAMRRGIIIAHVIERCRIDGKSSYMTWRDCVSHLRQQAAADYQVCRTIALQVGSEFFNKRLAYMAALIREDFPTRGNDERMRQITTAAWGLLRRPTPHTDPEAVLRARLRAHGIVMKETATTEALILVTGKLYEMVNRIQLSGAVTARELLAWSDEIKALATIDAVV